MAGVWSHTKHEQIKLHVCGLYLKHGQGQPDTLTKEQIIVILDVAK